MFNSFSRILALTFVGFSLYFEHFKHDLPQATLMIGWAILCRVASQDKDKD